MGLLKGFLNLIPGKSHRESIESKYNNSVAEEGIEDPVQATADFIIGPINKFSKSFSRHYRLRYSRCSI